VILAAALLALTVPVTKDPPSLDPGSTAPWPQSLRLELPWDVAHAHPAEEKTTVRLCTDGKFLYVRFDAQQSDPISATQHSDDLITGGSVGNQGSLSWSNDDAVWIDLWPMGAGGFQYQFEANPNGSHNESSTENTDFSPQWQSRGVTTAGGYTVTMAIPLGVIHGGRAGTWRAQFLRYTHASGAEYVWSYDRAQTQGDDVSRAGELYLPLVTARAVVPKPRIAPYALAALSSKSIGGSTSRVGADLSIPVTATSAFFATLHPDYSNVELDQQSIAPTVYQRIFSEVRPFFTQAASYYNDFNCDACGGFRTTLYTPAIPTPAQGYAFEGKEGDVGLAAFDAIGNDRTDMAGALDYTSDDAHWLASVQHVTADLPGLVDDSNEAGINWTNGKYLSAYVNYSTDSGTAVLDRSQGNAIDAGGGWIDQHFAVFGSLRSVGSYFNPVDGFDAHPGIAGYGLYSARVWTFSSQDVLSSVGIGGFVDRYQGLRYGQAQSDNSLTFDVLTKSAWDLQLYSGSDYWRFGPTLTPISQNAGFSLTYHSGLVNNLNNFPNHGGSSTPTQIQYYTGRYGLGRLDTWFRASTLRVGERGSLTFSADDTAQWLPHGSSNVQWFDGVAYAYQISAESSFAIGVRRIVGFPPQPNGGGDCAGRCSNISVAYHLRLRNEDFYLAYGDPNTLVTIPQAIFKVIFYAGGQKGT
jgi:hypothetical protein